MDRELNQIGGGRFAHERPTWQERLNRIEATLSVIPQPATVLDVGAGDLIYARLFDTEQYHYVAVDLRPTAHVVGSADALPFAPESFDLVICFQVLEHVDFPSETIEEFWRVLKPNGRALLTTHGVFPYHPGPKDLWRWTAEGLTQLFANAGFTSEVYGLAGTATSLAMTLAYYVHLLGERNRALRVVKPFVAAGIRVGRFMDNRVPQLRDPWQPGTLFSNYFVDAVKDG